MTGTFQISGLVSGLDTAKIIDTLMSVEKQPLKQLQDQQTLIQTRKQAYADLSAKLSALRTKTLGLMLSTNTQARTATSTNTGVAIATASPATALQQITLNVLQTATKTLVSSSAAIGQPIDPTVTLATAGFGTTPTSGTFSINNVPITIDVNTDTLNSVMTKINSSAAGVTATLSGNQLQLSSNTGPITMGVVGDTSNFLQSTQLAASSSVFDGVMTWTNTSAGGLGVMQPTSKLQSARFNTPLATPPSPPSGSFTINGVNFTWDGSTDTLNDIISRINTSAAKVTASYDPNTDKFSLVAKDTGPAAISLADTSGNLLDALGVSGAVQQYGQTAQYTINGGPVQSSTSNVVSNAVSGVTLTLKGTGATTIDIAQDIAKSVSNVKDWVQAYNDALGLLRQDLAVDPSTNKPSIFTGNAMIQSIEARLHQLPSQVATGLGTAYTDLTGIGISTGPIGSAPGSTNQLVLDENKLTQALQQDPNAVASLLTAASGPITSLNSYLLGMTSYTGPLGSSQTAADQQLSQLNSRMQSLQTRINQRQAALEKKFADLESAMAKLQAQSAQLAGQLGSLSSISTGGQ